MSFINPHQSLLSGKVFRPSTPKERKKIGKEGDQIVQDYKNQIDQNNKNQIDQNEKPQEKKNPIDANIKRAFDTFS